MTWLIVEDDPEIRNLVAVMMQVWGETPMALSDGNAAWRWLDSVVDGTFAGELPELALMDIRMPGHTGDQISARMRVTERLKNIPIILMTAFTLTETEVQAMIDRSGIDRVIKKPLPDMDEFRSTLYRVRDEKRKNLPNSKADAPIVPAGAVPPAPAKPPTTPTPPPVPKTLPLSTTPLRAPQTAILNPRPATTGPAKPTDSPKPASPSAPGPTKK